MEIVAKMNRKQNPLKNPVLVLRVLRMGRSTAQHQKWLDMIEANPDDPRLKGWEKDDFFKLGGTD